MQPVFVTGATGFLGAHLVCALLQKGYSVNALKRSQSSLYEFNFISGLYFGHDPGLVIKNLKWLEGDITDYNDLEENLEKNQIVFHCAGMVSFFKADREKLFKINVKGTENVVNACLAKGCKKLIHVSSTAAVGKTDNNEITNETHQWDEKDKPSNYSISKYYAELEVWRGIEEGLDAVIVNPPLIIGPCDWQKATGRFFINGSKNFPFYTDGSNAFVYVNDVAKAMITLAESDITAERFLLAGENMPLRHFMNLIADAFGKKRPSVKATPLMAAIAWRWFGMVGFITGTKGLITQESAASSLKNIQYSNKKIKEALGMEFTPIEDAVKETVSCFKNQ
ncbi:MAG: NAD-dependent epimerase/dehydratase family protein [Bacteroidia bacterium]